MISNFLKERKAWEVDLSLGEPKVSLAATLEVHGDLFKSFKFDDDDLAYQPYQGNITLVEELAYKHNVETDRIIITCGGKQGLCAAVYAAKKAGLIDDRMGMPAYIQQPSWPLLADPFRLNDVSFIHKQDGSSSLDLIVSPNNPDGRITLFDGSKPVIHDAVYACAPYGQKPSKKSLDTSFATIFSFSKEYGISGARTGYVICADSSTAKMISHYVEESSAGTSGFSQSLIAEILRRERKDYNVLCQRLSLARDHLRKCYLYLESYFRREIFVRSNPNTDFPFAWLKKGSAFDQSMFNKLSIKLMDGAGFGDANFVRLNMAAGQNSFIEAENRLKGELFPNR